ncbi:MAG: hypothetical protein QM766_27505 [Burkholderiaceae bacterium]
MADGKSIRADGHARAAVGALGGDSRRSPAQQRDADGEGPAASAQPFTFTGDRDRPHMYAVMPGVSAHDALNEASEMLDMAISTIGRSARDMGDNPEIQNVLRLHGYSLGTIKALVDTALFQPATKAAPTEPTGGRESSDKEVRDLRRAAYDSGWMAVNVLRQVVSIALLARGSFENAHDRASPSHAGHVASALTTIFEISSQCADCVVGEMESAGIDIEIWDERRRADAAAEARSIQAGCKEGA